MTDEIEKREPGLAPIVGRLESSVTALTVDTTNTNRLDMSENALKAEILPAAFAEAGQTLRSLLGFALIAGVLWVGVSLFGKTLPADVLQTAMWTSAMIAVANGKTLGKLVDKWGSKTGTK